MRNHYFYFILFRTSAHLQEKTLKKFSAAFILFYCTCADSFTYRLSLI